MQKNVHAHLAWIDDSLHDLLVKCIMNMNSILRKKDGETQEGVCFILKNQMC